MKKIVFIAIFIVTISQTIFAGQFAGLKFIKDDYTTAKSEWITFDKDGDGKEEYYYFNSDGILVINDTTPDGYQVNDKGQWIKNGKIQLKDNPKSNRSSSPNYTNSTNIDSTFSDTADAISNTYSQSLELGKQAMNSGMGLAQDAFEVGMDLGQQAVESSMDLVGNMYGGVLKGAVNEYKKEYNAALDEYKKEYNNALNDYKKEFNSAMNDYTKEFNSAMNQYKNALDGLKNFKW